jgi:hypothetical protein
MWPPRVVTATSTSFVARMALGCECTLRESASAATADGIRTRLAAKAQRNVIPILLS